MESIREGAQGVKTFWEKLVDFVDPIIHPTAKVEVEDSQYIKMGMYLIIFIVVYKMIMK